MPLQEDNISILVSLAFAMPLFLSLIVVWFIYSYQRRKVEISEQKAQTLIRERELEREKQNELQLERNRIATEMHDDLGSRLTSINYIVQDMVEKSENSEDQDKALRIQVHTSHLIRNMSEIIWAMNNRYDDLQSLVDYIRRMLSDLLEEMGKKYTIFIHIIDEKEPISGEKRRNILLILKETIHNSIKYSKATKLTINIEQISQFLEIVILEEGGVGFDMDKKLDAGNGLYNIRKRLNLMNASGTYSKVGQGMKITFEIPL